MFCPHCGAEVSNIERRPTPRAYWVADLVADGLPNREIAKLMGITPRTVKAYMSRLLRFYGVRSRIGLALILNKKRVDSAGHQGSELAYSGQEQPRNS